MRFDGRCTLKGRRATWTAALALMGLVLALVGCGGTALTHAGPSTPKTAVQIRMGDAPSDLVVSLQLTIQSIVATSSVDGSTTPLLSQPTTVEVTHLADAGEPLESIEMMPGSYSQMTLEVSAAAVTFLNSSTGQPVQQHFSYSPNEVTTINLSPALTIGSSTTVLNFDVDVPSTVNLNVVTNTVSLNVPVISVASSPMGPTAGPQTPENGGVLHAAGTVTNVAGSSFTLQVGQTGTALVFVTDGSTQFTNANYPSLASIANSIVVVQGKSQDDGSLLATSVNGLEAATGVELEGLMTGRNPSTNLSLVVQDGAGQAITPSMVGSTVSVDISQVNNFYIHAEDVDLTGINYTFDGSDFAPGQRMLVESGSPLQADPEGNVGLMSPTASVTLEEQIVTGTVSNYLAGQNPGTFEFDVNLPADGTSYLTVIDPTITVVHVVQQAATDTTNMTSGISNGASVHVRGLLFCSLAPPAAANARSMPMIAPKLNPKPYIMVAGRINP
jgi:Domain of unknown function (DUF4382)